MKKKKNHLYERSMEQILNSFEILNHSQFIINSAILDTLI